MKIVCFPFRIVNSELMWRACSKNSSQHRDRFLFCAEAIYKSQAETGEIKGHYLNATAGTCEEMIKRAVFAREFEFTKESK